MTTTKNASIYSAHGGTAIVHQFGNSRVVTTAVRREDYVARQTTYEVKRGGEWRRGVAAQHHIDALRAKVKAALAA